MSIFGLIQVAVPNLFYGKTLIELAQQGENKLLVIPEDENEAEEDEEKGGDNADTDTDDDDENSSEVPSLVPNGSNSLQDAKSSALPSKEPQPGTSSGIHKNNGNSNDNCAGNDEGETNENLQYAWEALEMAAKIFQRLGKGYEEYLAEAHYGLGEILMENQNCSEAIRDYSTFG